MGKSASEKEIMEQIPKIDITTNKEPWLAASLSWLLPGLGQIYSKVYNRGVSIFIFALFLLIFGIFSLLSLRTSVTFSLLLGFTSIIILPLYASIDAFKITRKYNTDDFERERILSKDPWLAVFLSIVFPGLGHFYTRKRIFGILFLFSFVVLGVMSQKNYYALFAVIILPAVAAIHTYFLRSIHKANLKRPLILFVILLLCARFLNGFLMPLVVCHFFVHAHIPTVGPSMEPTILDGSRIVVDKISYTLKEPTIGEIVQFIPPEPENVTSDYPNTMCKRIVAVGGETVQVRKKVIYVDDKKREVRDPNRRARPRSTPPIDFSGVYNPYLAHGVHEPYRVPEGHYFVLGDNLSHSVDSRFFGAVPRENITGKVIKISWPSRCMGLVR